jgi:hypothetical protein
LLSALSRLAGTVEELAGTLSEANAALRGRLQLDAPDQPGTLEHEPAAEGNGTGRRRKQTA